MGLPEELAATERREATPAEFKALAHPLRLRILRLCLDESLTNKQIADRLGKHPATVLHHVRLLAETDFLRAEEPRTGTKGALEKPYRATGKSWRFSSDSYPPDDRLATQLAMVDAFREELALAGPDSVRGLSRLGVRLNEASVTELADRLDAIVEELAVRSDDPDGERYAVFYVLHRRA